MAADAARHDAREHEEEIRRQVREHHRTHKADTRGESANVASTL